ncbi:MAG: hypothetical protein EXR72_20845 [Myxococcales bacterium]|nr:hypothetical protein [Myxococcales bacterium]
MYSFMGGVDVPELDQNRFFAFLAVSTDGADTFAPAFSVSGADPTFVDGPKTAISRDGAKALVSWVGQELVVMGGQTKYRQQPFFAILDIQNNVQLLWRATMSPLQWGIAPTLKGMAGVQECEVPATGVSYRVASHPIIASGLSGSIYLALTITYYGFGNGCSSLGELRHEVYRSETGAAWDRILSVKAARVEDLLAVRPGGGEFKARRGTSPSFVVTRQMSEGQAHDIVVLAVAEQRPAVLPNEMSRQKVVVYRLVNAESCIPLPAADRWSCGVQDLAGYEVDKSVQAHGKPWLENRAGVWQFQPALFGGESGEDSRVGLFWYTQPFRGQVASLDKRRETIVEGATSLDAGASFGVVSNITVKNGDGDNLFDPPIGQYFVPCPTFNAMSPDTLGYFGDDIGGAFFDEDPGSIRAVGSWTDARLGCAQQGRLSETFHQHAYGGTTWW